METNFSVKFLTLVIMKKSVTVQNTILHAMQKGKMTKQFYTNKHCVQSKPGTLNNRIQYSKIIYLQIIPGL